MKGHHDVQGQACGSAMVCLLQRKEAVNELSQFDLEVYRSETLPDAPEVTGNLAGLYCNLEDFVSCSMGDLLCIMQSLSFGIVCMPGVCMTL